MSLIPRVLHVMFAFAILTVLAIVFCAPEDAQAAEDRPVTWYAQALIRGEAGLNVTNFWSKGPWLRAETIVAGHKIITIVRGDTYYAYDGLTGKGLAIRREPAAIARQKQTPRPFGNEYRILEEQGAEKVRDERTLGRPTGVYRITDEVGKRELWVTEDEARIPLRVEIFDRASGQKRTTDYLNWQSDFAIPDAFFEPEPRAKFEKLDYREYLARSAAEGTVGPVPVLYSPLLFTLKRD